MYLLLPGILDALILTNNDEDMNMINQWILIRCDACSFYFRSQNLLKWDRALYYLRTGIPYNI